MKNLILMKTLLVTILIGVGQSAWADTKTYDFYTYVVNSGVAKNGVASELTLTGDNIATADASNVIMIADISGLAFDGRFAADNTDIKLRHGGDENRGIQNTNGTKHFSILDLKQNDVVTILVAGDGDTKFVSTNAKIGDVAITADQTITKNTSTICTMTADGNLDLKLDKWAVIKSVSIESSRLATPTITFSGLAKNDGDGLYYPQITITSTDEGVTFYNGSGVEITSPYTFTATGTLAVYAGKDGSVNSAKAYYTAENSYILANTIDVTTFNKADFSGNGTTKANEYYWIAKDNPSNNTTVIPGLTFTANNWALNFQNALYIQNRNSNGKDVNCTVLNTDRLAALTDNNGNIVWLDNSNYTTNYGQWAGVQKYQLFTTSSATVSVTIGSTGYSTFSSPVPLDFSSVEGLTAYVATTVADSKVTLTSVTTAPANTGLVLKGTASQEYTIPVSASAATPASNLLQGCIVSTAVSVDATSGYNNYVLVNEGGTAKFQSLVANGATIPAGKAYLRNGAYSAARSLSIEFADETTSIQNVKKQEMGAENYYDLQGRRVENPTKGLYIVNGKKIIVK